MLHFKPIKKNSQALLTLKRTIVFPRQILFKTFEKCRILHSIFFEFLYTVKLHQDCHLYTFQIKDLRRTLLNGTILDEFFALALDLEGRNQFVSEFCAITWSSTNNLLHFFLSSFPSSFLHLDRHQSRFNLNFSTGQRVSRNL